MKKAVLNIKGMHCPSCNILVKDKLKAFRNIKEVKPDFKTQTAEVIYTGTLNLVEINRAISPFGYSIVKDIELESRSLYKWFDFVVILIIFGLVYLILKEVNLWPDFSYTNLSLAMVFLLGVIASTSTCMATTGALYLAISQKSSKLTTAFSFSLGRVLAYGVFGLIFGFLGKAIVSSVLFSSFLTLIISLMMIFLGLDLAGIFTSQRLFSFGFTGRIFEFFETRLRRYPRRLPFFLGAITYFLPCGFTQSIQVYSIGLADPWASSLNMTIFALGTLPLIFFINLAVNLRSFNFYQYFLRVTGALIFVIGLSYLSNFFSLLGVNLPISFFSYKEKAINSLIFDGKQVIRMTVDASGYQPNYFLVKKGLPVRWEIEGKNVLGCQGYFVVPKLGISQALKEGKNIFEFTPKEEGIIGFSCGMGMFKGVIEVKS